MEGILIKRLLALVFLVAFVGVADATVKVRELKYICAAKSDDTQTLEFWFEGKKEFSLLFHEKGSEYRKETKIKKEREPRGKPKKPSKLPYTPVEMQIDLYANKNVGLYFALKVTPCKPGEQCKPEDPRLTGFLKEKSSQEKFEYWCDVPSYAPEDYVGYWKLQQGDDEADLHIESRNGKSLKMTRWAPGKVYDGKEIQCMDDTGKHKDGARFSCFSGISKSYIFVLETYKLDEERLFTYQKRYFLSPDKKTLMLKGYFATDTDEEFAAKEHDPYFYGVWNKVE